MKTIILPKNVQRFDASTLTKLSKSQDNQMRSLSDNESKRVQYRLGLLPNEYKILLEKDFRKYLSKKQIDDLQKALSNLALADYSENKFLELATNKIQESFPAEALVSLNLEDKNATAQSETESTETQELSFYEKNKTYIMIGVGLLLVGGIMYYYKNR